MSTVDINHYLDVFRYPSGRFRTLRNVVCIQDTRGDEDFRAGSRSVLFHIRNGSGKFAIKCYKTGDPNRKNHLNSVVEYLNRLNSEHLTPFEYLDDELWVFDDHGTGSWRPAMLSPWVEGSSLSGWITKSCETKNIGALREMADRFARLGLGLLEQEWAHGDLKPDNLIVTPQGSLRLIDYDNAFVPALAGQLSPELGTPGFQHPAREAKFYDARLDDYAIALITCALYALAEFPEWHAERADEELLLFDPTRAVAGTDPLLQRLRAHWLDGGHTALYRLATLLGSPSPVLPELTEVLERVLETPVETPRECAEIFRKKGFYGYAGLTEAIYDDAAPFADGLALVRMGKKRYFIDRTGKKRLDAGGWERVDSFSEGLAAVQKKGKWGYVDPGGAVAIPPMFDSALAFREGTAVVRSGDRYGYIDRRGAWLFEPVYTFAAPFRGGTAVAEKEGAAVRLKWSEL